MEEENLKSIAEKIKNIKNLKLTKLHINLELYF